MKLWKVEYCDYFGNAYSPLYYDNRAAAEEHANAHPHYAKVSYAGNFSEARAARFLTPEEEARLSPADFYEYVNAEIKYISSYAEYPAYRAGYRAGFV